MLNLFLCDLELDRIIEAAHEEDEPIEQLLQAVGIQDADLERVQIQLRQHAAFFQCFVCERWEFGQRDSELCQECAANSCQECGDTLFVDGLCLGCHRVVFS